MKLVVQRVSKASVNVNNKTVGQINQGLLVYLGISNESLTKDIDKYIKKLINLRIFADHEDKMNLSVKDVDGAILVVSQFTLYGSVKGGNRPSFTNALNPEYSKPFYDLFVSKLQKEIAVETGIFGAMMAVESTNDGPVTIIIEDL